MIHIIYYNLGKSEKLYIIIQRDAVGDGPNFVRNNNITNNHRFRFQSNIIVVAFDSFRK